MHATLKFETKILRSDFICPGEPHQRSPNAPKFEDRSQEETDGQELGAREAAWKLAKSVLKLKEHERATFFSPSENRCQPASKLKPEEREFVVDSGASMHTISKKDLNSAEMDTLTKSCSPTIVITANGEVQTHEEAIVYVKELDIFLTMKVLENTPAVLSLGKLCDENGYSYEWINGHLIKNGIRIPCNTENFVPIVVPGLSSSSSGSSSTLRTLMKQENHSSSSSSSSPFSSTVGEIQTRDRGDRIESDISPVPVSHSVDDRSGRPDDTQANNHPKKSKKEPKMERSDPDSVRVSSEIPEWLQEFRENLVDDKIPVHGDSHASSSHEASLEPTSTRSADLGKNNVYPHFPEDRNCEICQRTKITRASCRRGNGGAVPRAENFGDLITPITKFSVKDVNRGTIIDTLWWYKTWQRSGYNPTRVRQRLLRNWICKRSWSPIGILKSFTLTIPWNSAKLVNISPGINARLHHTDQKQLGLLKEQCAE